MAIGSTGSYLIKASADSAFTSKVKGSKTGVIKMTANSIVLDTSKTYICVDDDTLEVTDRSSSSASCTGEKTNYSCEDGVCKEGDEAPDSSKYYLSKKKKKLFKLLIIWKNYLIDRK